MKNPERFAPLALSLTLLCGAATVLGQPVAADRYPVEKWMPFGLYPAGAEVAPLHGAPDKPGLFVVRIKYPANYRLPAHTHNIDFVVTVLSGTYYSGTGDRSGAGELKALGPGATVIEPAGVAHFAETRGEPVIVQAVGLLPATTSFVNPADDPRKK